MKSKEEFIAGIYEKAAVYTKEQEIEKKWYYTISQRKIKIAAMVAVCIGLTGVSALLFDTKTPENQNTEYGISMTSELSGEELGTVVQFHRMVVAETVTVTGIVESVDIQEHCIWLRLELEENLPDEQEMVCLYWDIEEEISPAITTGVRLQATGELATYEAENSIQQGCAKLIVTEVAQITIVKE